MSGHLVAAVILAVAALAMWLPSWWQKGQADLDRHIAEALDGPDFAANRAAFDSMPRERVR